MDGDESRLEEKVLDPNADGGIRTITWLAKCAKAGCKKCPGVTVESNPNGTQTLACGMCNKVTLEIGPDDPGPVVDPGDLEPIGDGEGDPISP